MANPTTPDIDVAPSAFVTTYANELSALKQNFDSNGNLIGSLPVSAITGLMTAEYGNVVDDLLLLYQSRLSNVFRSVMEFGVVADGAADGSGTDTTTEFQAAIDGTPDGGTLMVSAGTYLCSDLAISGRNNLTLLGAPGAIIQWTGTQTLGSLGLRLSGTCSGITIRGLTFRGEDSLTVADRHVGIWTGSSAPTPNLTDVVVDDCDFIDLIIGVSMDQSGGGSLTNPLVHNCRFRNIYGIASGEGYGVHFASAQSTSMRAKVTGNDLDQCQRHSFYFARGSGVKAIGNTITRHRDGTTDGAVRGAIVVARMQDVDIIGNTIDRSNNACLQVNTDTIGLPCRNVNFIGNTITGRITSANEISEIFCCTSGVSGDLSEISFVGNNVRVPDSQTGIEIFRLVRGVNVLIKDNVFRYDSTSANVNGIATITGEANGNGIDNLHWIGNRFVGRPGSYNMNGIRINPTAATTAAVAQVVTVDIDGTTDGTFTVTINGNDYDFVASSSTGSAIEAGLISAINAGSDPVTAAPGTGDQLTVTADVAGDPFTYATDHSTTPADISDALTTAYVSRGRMLFERNTYDIVPTSGTTTTFNIPTAVSNDGIRVWNQDDGGLSFAAGTYIAGIPFGGVTIHTGAGTPEGNVTAGPGDVYHNESGGAGTSLYLKESGTGNTGWVAVRTAGSEVTFPLSGDVGSTLTYLGFGPGLSSGAITEGWVQYMAPFDGVIEDVTLHCIDINYGSTIVGSHIDENATPADTDTQTLDTTSGNVVFTLGTAFSAGDRLSLSFDAASAGGEFTGYVRLSRT